MTFQWNIMQMIHLLHCNATGLTPLIFQGLNPSLYPPVVGVLVFGGIVASHFPLHPSIFILFLFQRHMHFLLRLILHLTVRIRGLVGLWVKPGVWGSLGFGRFRRAESLLPAMPL